MTELSLEQIQRRLNEEFNSDNRDFRKIIFWFDDNKEFEQDLDQLDLVNTKVHKLTPNNLFKTKLLLEREDKDNNYLIYAPFSKTEIENSHLEDIILYSKQFLANRIDAIIHDLNIDRSLYSTLEKYRTFFNAQSRRKKFYDLNIEKYTKKHIEIGLLNVLVDSKSQTFETVLSKVLTKEDLEDNQYLNKFEKYGLLETFWEYCQLNFHYYPDSDPNLKDLLKVLFINAISLNLDADVPEQWKSFITNRRSNISNFLELLMKNIDYNQEFKKLAKDIENDINANLILSNESINAIYKIEFIPLIDELIINWIIKQLENKDSNITIDRIILDELINYRLQTFFGKDQKDIYLMLKYAANLLSLKIDQFNSLDSLKELIDYYTSEGYKVDYYYRKFIQYYDKVDDPSRFDSIKELVERVYTANFLEPIIYNWTKHLGEIKDLTKVNFQKNFYQFLINPLKERTAVIISDALRYEIGADLKDRFKDDGQLKVELDSQISTLPSYTSLGMAALLPHNTLELSSDYYRGSIDSKEVNTTIDRQRVLQEKGNSNNIAIPYNDIKNLKAHELRDLFKGKEIIYIYHDQIDNIGDKPGTEDQVFNASEQTINEIYNLVTKLYKSANTRNFIITSDHGFIYRKDKVEEYDKIPLADVSHNIFSKTKRSAISSEPLNVPGTISYSLANFIDDSENNFVTVPITHNIFNTPGPGVNYVHGGASPQEMIIPLIKIKAGRQKIESTPAEINLLTNLKKITNMTFNLEFIQKEPISETVKENSFVIYFKSSDGEIISNEITLTANSRHLNAENRTKKFKFHLKEQKYDNKKDYYLVIENTSNSTKSEQYNVIIDIPFGDDYGFEF